MIRANLLPRSSDAWRLFGAPIERGFANAILAGLATVSAVAAITFGIETLAFVRLERQAIQAQSAAAAGAPLRERAQHLALDVARYEEFERELQIARSRDSQIAGDVVRVGNAVPPDVRLDGLVATAGRIELTGTSTSLETMGGALDALDRALPGTAATLVNLERRDERSPSLRFAARLEAP